MQKEKGAMVHTVDDIMREIGSMGRFQIFVMFLLGWFSFCLTFHPLLSVFTAAEPAWRCTRNNTYCTLNGSFVPGDGDVYTARCKMPRESWEFEPEFTSIITEWDIVCDRSILGSLSSSIYFAGMFVGVLIFGVLSDKFGRKPTLFLATLLASLSGLCCGISPNFEFYCVFKVLVGITAGGAVAVYFLIASEMTGVRHRGTAGTLIWIYWTVSMMALALFAFLIPDWRQLSIVTSCLGFTCLFTWPWIPESPRWLLVHQKMDKLMNLLENIAAVNEKEMPEGEVGLPDPNKKPRGNFLDMFRTRNLAIDIFIQWFAWFVISMVYYGVTMSAGTFSGNFYLIFFLNSAVEIPGLLMSIWLMNRFGRKKATIGTIAGAALGAILAAVFPRNVHSGYETGRNVMGIFAKMNITATFAIIYVYTTELMPTIVRNVGLGSCSSAARIGSFAGPLLAWMERVDPMLPFGIMGLAALITGLLCLMLPETLNKPTREVLSDGDSSGGDSSTKPLALDHNCNHPTVSEEKKFLGELYTTRII